MPCGSRGEWQADPSRNTPVDDNGCADDVGGFIRREKRGNVRDLLGQTQSVLRYLRLIGGARGWITAEPGIGRPRFDGARTDRVHSDAVMRILDRGSSGEVLDRGLRCAVRAESRYAA